MSNLLENEPYSDYSQESISQISFENPVLNSIKKSEHDSDYEITLSDFSFRLENANDHVISYKHKKESQQKLQEQQILFSFEQASESFQHENDLVKQKIDAIEMSFNKIRPQLSTSPSNENNSMKSDESSNNNSLTVVSLRDQIKELKKMFKKQQAKLQKFMYIIEGASNNNKEFNDIFGQIDISKMSLFMTSLDNVSNSLLNDNEFAIPILPVNETDESSLFEATLLDLNSNSNFLENDRKFSFAGMLKKSNPIKQFYRQRHCYKQKTFTDRIFFKSYLSLLRF